MLEDLVIAVPGGADAVDLLATRLEELGLVGWVIDGARLGHDGWALARVAADDEGALTTGDDDAWGLLEIDDLHAVLAQTWPEAQVDLVLIDGQVVIAPLCQSETPRLHEVALATAQGMGLALEASLEKLTLAEVRMGSKTLFARVQPIDGPEHELVDVFSTAKGGSVILWRREPHLVLQVMHRSREAELHVWEPSWTPIGPSEHDDVRDELRPPRGDAAAIVDVLGLPSGAADTLDTLLRGATPPLNQLCAALGLPDEAARVLSGECSVEELPGAVVHEPKKLLAAVREAVRSSDDDPAWVQWMDAGARDVKPWYVVSSLSSAVLGIVLVTRWRSGGSRFWGGFGLASVAGTVVDLPTRWWLKRRRDAAS